MGTQGSRQTGEGIKRQEEIHRPAAFLEPFRAERIDQGQKTEQQ